MIELTHEGHQARRLRLGLYVPEEERHPQPVALQVALEGVGAAQTWALRGGLTEVELVLPPWP